MGNNSTTADLMYADLKVKIIPNELYDRNPTGLISGTETLSNRCQKINGSKCSVEKSANGEIFLRRSGCSKKIYVTKDNFCGLEHGTVSQKGEENKYLSVIYTDRTILLTTGGKSDLLLTYYNQLSRFLDFVDGWAISPSDYPERKCLLLLTKKSLSVATVEWHVVVHRWSIMKCTATTVNHDTLLVKVYRHDDNNTAFEWSFKTGRAKEIYRQIKTVKNHAMTQHQPSMALPVPPAPNRIIRALQQEICSTPPAVVTDHQPSAASGYVPMTRATSHEPDRSVGQAQHHQQLGPRSISREISQDHERIVVQVDQVYELVSYKADYFLPVSKPRCQKNVPSGVPPPPLPERTRNFTLNLNKLARQSNGKRYMNRSYKYACKMLRESGLYDSPSSPPQQLLQSASVDSTSSESPGLPSRTESDDITHTLDAILRQPMGLQKDTLGLTVTERQQVCLRLYTADPSGITPDWIHLAEKIGLDHSACSLIKSLVMNQLCRNTAAEMVLIHWQHMYNNHSGSGDYRCPQPCTRAGLLNLLEDINRFDIAELLKSDRASMC